MLDVAARQIEEDGLGVGLDQVRMEDVIREAGVSRATAYRRWATREDFLADVLVETVRRTSLIPETEGDVARLLEIVSRHRDRLPTEQGRRDVVVEGLRVAVDADIRRILASPRWRAYLALVSTHQTLKDERVKEVVGRALAEADAAFCERRAQIYARLADFIGYRVGPSWLPSGAEGFLALGVEAGAVMTGMVVGCLARPGSLDDRVPARLFGESVEAMWSAPERLLVGLLLTHLQPDPSVVWTEEAVASRFGRFEAVARDLYAETSGPPEPVGQDR